MAAGFGVKGAAEGTAGPAGPSVFVRVHRSVVVKRPAIHHDERGLNGTADIHAKGKAEVLPVSPAFLHLFRQM